MNSSRFVRRVTVLTAATALLAGALPVSAGPPQRAAQRAPSRQFEITTLSTRPDTVSGGEVLVQIEVPRRVRPRRVRVRMDGRDITRAFRPSGERRTLTGLVEGLEAGVNTLEVSGARRGRGRGRVRSELDLTNHPRSGPVFSGRQQQPFICQTEAFGLGPAVDDDCRAATQVEYLYRSTETDAFEPFDQSAPRPDDIAQTTTTEGNEVDYVVRLERGTINRAVYEIAFLHEPSDPLPDPWTNVPGWNDRLIYQFGGGCNAGYHQGASTGGVLDNGSVEDRGLANGYAVTASSLNVFGTKCDDVISAETTMMVKEHFVEQFGVPDHTVGLGTSGGSMQQHLIAQNYPGLLDGILPGRSFPDTLTFGQPYIDCELLEHAFAGSRLRWTDDDKAAVAGHRNYDYCAQNTSWSQRLVHPDELCDPSIPAALIYDPITNPDGARCTLYDDMVNVYGIDPQTGFARRPLDNVGVQYGLDAFNAGAITARQFIQLNRRVGGHDIDGNLVRERTEANDIALRIAYQTGRINAGYGLDDIPIIDFRHYLDEVGDVHDAVRSQVMRARLIAANGHADNQVIITISDQRDFAAEYFEMIVAMDDWLTEIDNDTAGGSAAEKVVRNKPADLVDACYTAADEKITDPAACEELYPSNENPRLAAGGPLTDDVLKCTLRPLDASDYEQRLNARQLERLQAAFDSGVCDYDRPGVEQQPPVGTWLEY